MKCSKPDENVAMDRDHNITASLTPASQDLTRGHINVTPGQALNHTPIKAGCCRNQHSKPTLFGVECINQQPELLSADAGLSSHNPAARAISHAVAGVRAAIVAAPAPAEEPVQDAPVFRGSRFASLLSELGEELVNVASDNISDVVCLAVRGDRGNRLTILPHGAGGPHRGLEPDELLQGLLDRDAQHLTKIAKLLACVVASQERLGVLLGAETFGADDSLAGARELRPVDVPARELLSPIDPLARSIREPGFTPAAHGRTILTVVAILKADLWLRIDNKAYWRYALKSMSANGKGEWRNGRRWGLKTRLRAYRPSYSHCGGRLPSSAAHIFRAFRWRSASRFFARAVDAIRSIFSPATRDDFAPFPSVRGPSGVRRLQSPQRCAPVLFTERRLIVDRLYNECGVRTADAWTWLIIAVMAAACVAVVAWTAVPV